ncbi:hypothetical protein [Dyadobacter sp. 3J3]|uniref:hypothetical protein n=1 Tax=Dyadobacter sp. 3J3 TaxID=2606600 RepID=UPI001E58FF31|nr:hypothetical protein [Dyadobacter sp. 3J3]
MIFNPKYIKDDWVKRKGSSQLMQIDEYQTEITDGLTTSWGIKTAQRRYNGKVWCTWVNQNNALVTEPFLESDLEPVRWPEPAARTK